MNEPPLVSEPSPDAPRALSTSGKRWHWTVWLLLIGLLGLGLPPLLSWQRAGEQRARSLSNLRRLANGLLLYAQDWDGRAMPTVERLPSGRWRTWEQTLRPYVSPASVFSNPSNPVENGLRHPLHGYPIHTSYALNRRFWNTFSPGPFPLENLELPGQTALFVEAGRMGRDPRLTPRCPPDSPPFALLDYGDMLDRVQGLCPYPSTHDGMMALVAADAHAVAVRVEHYVPDSTPHDPLYGQIGDNIYNWNGGHPNGETDRPLRQ